MNFCYSLKCFDFALGAIYIIVNGVYIFLTNKDDHYAKEFKNCILNIFEKSDEWILKCTLNCTHYTQNTTHISYI